MVTEARDTLRANETQEELKEVFEGSCALIPIKVALPFLEHQVSIVFSKHTSCDIFPTRNLFYKGQMEF